MILRKSERVSKQAKPCLFQKLNLSKEKIMTVTRGQDYKVQEGDNLLKIAQQAGVPLQALIDANKTILIQGPDHIEPDWVLHIP